MGPGRVPLPLRRPNPPTFVSTRRHNNTTSPPSKQQAEAEAFPLPPHGPSRNEPCLLPAVMEPWQGYSDPAGGGGGGSRRYNGSSQQQQQPSPRDYNSPQQQQQHQQQPPQGSSSQQQQQPPAGFKYDQYQGGLNNQSPMVTSPMTSPQLRDGNGDVAMHDAQDPHSGIKYPMRPHHQHHLSGSRAAAMYAGQEPSAAAQRYSPMEVLSPTSPYSQKPANQFPPQQQPSQRQSPTRPEYSPQTAYYHSRQAPTQLPPMMNAYASGQDTYSPSSGMGSMDGPYDPKSPRRAPQSSAPLVVDKGPVPELKKIRGPGDLRPKANPQPAFRRANPEGGFISVSRPLYTLRRRAPAFCVVY